MFSPVRSDQYSVDYEFYDNGDKISMVFEHLAEHSLEEETGVYSVHYVRIRKNEKGFYSRIEDTTYNSENVFKFYKNVLEISLHFCSNYDFKKVLIYGPSPKGETYDKKMRIYLKMLQKYSPKGLTFELKEGMIVVTKSV